MINILVILYIKTTVSVYLCEQCLEDSFNRCPFFVECFGGWRKGEPGEARDEGGGPAWVRGICGEGSGGGGASTGGGEGTSEEGPDGGSSMGALCIRFTLVLLIVLLNLINILDLPCVTLIG